MSFLFLFIYISQSSRSPWHPVGTQSILIDLKLIFNSSYHTFHVSRARNALFGAFTCQGSDLHLVVLSRLLGCVDPTSCVCACSPVQQPSSDVEITHSGLCWFVGYMDE